MSSHFISQLDSQRFGFKIAKLTNWDINIADVLDQLRKEDAKLVIARVNNEDLKVINTLEALGFRVKDTQLTYQYNIAPNHLKRPLYPFRIKEYTTESATTIGQIAYDAFLGYGHYFADNQLDKDRCAEIYQDWAENCCMDKKYADKVWIALVDSNVVGFVAFKIYEKNGNKYAAAAINAVAEKYRGRGIYQALISESIFWCHENQCLWQEHNVLTTNLPVQYALAKMGFTVVNAFMTLHYWVDEY